MLLIKSAIIISLVMLVLAVVVIHRMTKSKHSFDNQQKAVRNQYPSMLDTDRSESQH